MIYNFGVNKHTIVTVAERLKKRWKYLNEKYQSKIIANKCIYIYIRVLGYIDKLLVGTYLIVIDIEVIRNATCCPVVK